MRNLLFYVTFLCVTPMMGQNLKNFSIVFDYNDFLLEESDSMCYITSPKYQLTLDEDTLSPALPFIDMNILIGEGEEVQSISYSRNDTLVHNNVVIVPTPSAEPTNTLLTPQLGTRDITYTDTIYPQENVQIGGTFVMDGYRVFGLRVSPFIYHTDNRHLFFIDTLNIQLNLTQRNVARKNPMRAMTETEGGNNMKDIIANLVINPDELTALYGGSLSPTGDSLMVAALPTYDYIIVTNDSLKPHFQALADWKRTKGLQTKILTIEEIVQTYTGSTIQQKIKNALYDYYNGTYHGLKYVLLGGDIDIVPAQGCYATSSGHTETNMPTDLYYTSFQTMDWNTNGNTYYGEIEDSVVLGQDIFLSRVPVSNIQETNAFVKRLILYEKGTNTMTGCRLLMCGNKLGTYFNENGHVRSDAQIYGQYLYTNYIEPYWNHTRKLLYDTMTNFYGGNSYDFTAQNLQTELSQGYPFVFVDTHGSNTTWGMETEPHYKSTDALSLVNALSTEMDGCGTTHIITSACLTNAFDYTNTCLSEAFIRNPNSGVLTYTGCSRYGWFYKQAKIMGPSNQYNAQFFKTLFTHPTKRYGEIVAAMKAHFYTRSNTNSTYRWLLFGINPIGDPEMPIFTSLPKNFLNVTKSYQNGVLLITTGVENCTICVTSKDDSGMDFFNVVPDTSSTSFYLPTNTYNICITCPGYIPYIETFSNEAYIQNEVFDGDATIISDDIHIGKNITPLKPEGPVTIERGHTTIEHTTGVTIHDSFEVKTGATLLIEKNDD